MPRIFAEPGRLWLLVPALVAAVWVARGTSRRRVEWPALGAPGEPAPGGVWPWWFASLGLILALAGPRWGRVPGTDLPPGHDVVFLVDVSRSMGAEDAVPDRLGLATAAARSLIEQLKSESGDRVAVVAFAGRGVARCPMTDNLDAVIDCLDSLRPGTIEPGGTDLGAGLAVALDAFDASEHAEGRSIVVFSDGEDHAGTWTEQVGRLVNASIPVHVVAVGDLAKPYPVPGPAATPPEVTPVLTQGTDATLKQIAHATGGASVPLGVSSSDLGALYRDRIKPTVRSRRPAPRFSDRAERYAVFLAAALLIGSWEVWPRNRRHWFRRTNRAGLGRPRRWGRLVVIGLIAILLVLVSLAAIPDSPLVRAEDAARRGATAYREARFAAALEAFEAVISGMPANPIGPFDAGAALFALGRYPEAARRYEAARTRANRVLRVKVDYALGNCAAMMGDFAGAVRHYDACLTAPARSVALVPVRRDAAINRAFALARLAGPASDPQDDPGDGDGRKAGQDQPQSNRNGPAPRSDGGPDPDSAAGSAPDGESSGVRGPGGAGGSGAAVPEPESPDRRLDAALRRIRAAREKQPHDPPATRTPPGAGGSAKDW